MSFQTEATTVHTLWDGKFTFEKKFKIEDCFIDVGEKLCTEREPTNPVDKYAVCISWDVVLY